MEDDDLPIAFNADGESDVELPGDIDDDLPGDIDDDNDIELPNPMDDNDVHEVGDYVAAAATHQVPPPSPAALDLNLGHTRTLVFGSGMIHPLCVQ